MLFWRKFLVRSLLLALVIVLSLFTTHLILAATSPWSQTDWSGGSGQSIFTDTTKYSSGGNVKTSSANQITISPKNVGNLGTGNDGAITVSTDKNINTDNMITGRSCSDGGDAVNYSVTASVSPGASSITLSSTPASGCLTVGDEILIINLQGTSSDNSNVGKYETATISSISTATLTLSGTLSNAYDGTTQKIMVQRVPNYTNVTVSSGKTLTASAWNGTKGGVLLFRATGTVTVTGTISASSLGFRGGTNNANGESYDGSVGTGGAVGAAGTSGGGSGSGSSSLPAAGTRGGGGGGGATDLGGDQGSGGGAGGGYGGGGGGGGGGNDCGNTAGNGGSGGGTGVNAGGGGGGGGYISSCSTAGAGGNAGSSGTNATNTGLGGAAGSGSTTGQGGSGGNGNGPGGTGGVGSGGGGGGGTYGSSTLATLFFGSGGGGGNNSGHNGQAAGGIISISANVLTNNGSITANGGNATVSSDVQGSGGAGAGGSVLLSANTLTVGSNTVTASGGSSSNASADGGGGGGGGVGRIAAYSANSISGTTSPTYATTAIVYNGSGTLTSSIFDTSFTSVSWGTLTFATTTPTNTTATVKVRTGNQPDLSDGTAFSSCTAISSGGTVSSNSCVSSSAEYVQYQISLSTTDTSVTPTFTSFSLAFSQNSSTSSASSSAPSVCIPVLSTGPNLYEIDPSTTSATLYFVPVSNASSYSIFYGLTTDASDYSTSFNYEDHGGAIKYTINNLATNTPYYFKIKGQNGCSITNWSQVVKSATFTPHVAVSENTQPSVITVEPTEAITPILDFTPTPTVAPKLTTTQPEGGYSIAIKVQNNGTPVANAKVTLHSIPREAMTDQNGIAKFSNVEGGEHTVLVAYNGYNGQENITLNGDQKDVAINLNVQLNNTMNFIYYGIVGGLIIIIGILMFFLLKRKNKNKI